ncbi:sigma-70 family RNA polymerase sigma factor [Micromonospora sp. DH14]|nr:sigma-70 family RNA polymerase sigma factor [Micromonospora sp. DH14]
MNFDRMTIEQRQDRLAALYTEHAGPLLKFLRRLTKGERTSAEDFLQETMIRAWRNLETVPTESVSQRRWLFTVARRIAIDAMRMRHARPNETSLHDYTNISATDDTSEIVLAADALRQAARDLSPAHRAVLSELYFVGCTIQETALKLGLPVGTVKSRAHYALRCLRAASFTAAA